MNRTILHSDMNCFYASVEIDVYKRQASDEERVWSLFRGATWWLPLTDSFLFQGPLPTDDTAAIATISFIISEKQ